MKNFSEGAKIGLTLCSQSYLVGGNWGYLNREHTDYERLLSMLKEEKSVIKLLPVSNGVIVIGNLLVLKDLITEVEPELITAEVQKAHQGRKAVEKHKCLKFFEAIVKGTAKYGNSYNGFTEYNIGIYSSNDTSKIRLNGIDYPAYKLTVQEMIECLKQLNRFKKTYVKTEIGGTQGFISIPEILKEQNGVSAIINGLELSPTGTGVFLTLRV